MTGSSTPTRSCLKRRLQSAKNSISGSLSSSGSCSSGANSSRNSLCKTVSFDGKDNVFFCDPDYDRHSVPVAHKLSYEDILELKLLNINMMCPQNSRCAPVVPVGIMPLLPTSDSPPHSASSTTSNPASSALFRPKQAPTHNNHHYGRHNFVNLLDDESSSMSSITPPPSSPSEYSPNMAPMPIIATDEEGQLIFSFSEPDEIESSQANTHSLHFATRNSRRHDLITTSGGTSAEESEDENGEHVKPGVPHAVALSQKLSTIAEKAVIEPPFPVPPSQPTLSHNHAALTLTPSFFTLPPSSSSSSSSNSSSPNSATDPGSASPFPFAPPVPTTTGLSIQPAAAMTMTLSDSLSGQNSNEEVTSDASVHATTTSTPTSPISQALNHHRSTSSSASTIVPTNNNNTQSPVSPTSPSSSSTPHASPTLLMRARQTAAATPSLHQQVGQAPPVAGPLAALQHQPRSPQLSGLPSPSLIPPSPLSLYPPSLDLNNNNTTTPGTVPTGFFPEKKKGIAGSGILGHMKRSSGSALARPTSPVVKPLAS